MIISNSFCHWHFSCALIFTYNLNFRKITKYKRIQDESHRRSNGGWRLQGLCTVHPYAQHFYWRGVTTRDQWSPTKVFLASSPLCHMSMYRWQLGHWTCRISKIRLRSHLGVQQSCVSVWCLFINVVYLMFLSIMEHWLVSPSSNVLTRHGHRIVGKQCVYFNHQYWSIYIHIFKFNWFV